MSRKIFMRKCCFLRSSIYFFAILVIGFNSCRPVDSEQALINEWLVTNYSTPLHHSGGDGPVSIFRIYQNGKYSQFGSGYFAFGVWRFNKIDSLLWLHPTNGTEILDAYYKLEKISSGHLQVSLYRNLPIQPGNAELSYSLQAGFQSSGPEDPYSPELHKWRIKPSHPETDVQIANRAKSYLKFLKNYYRYAIRNKVESMPTNWYPHPLRMHYGNGVRMAYNNELDDWYPCFFDSAQANKAYSFISSPLYDVKIKETENKFERNLDCVEQLLQMMEK